MKADIWMPLYIADYLADTMRLSTEQHGAYLLLLMDYWRSGPLPDNDQVLASIARLSIDRWKETRGLLVGFFSVSDGFWIHKRADAEIAKAVSFRAKQKANGSKGGRPRQEKEPRENPAVNPEGSPDKSPSPSPSHVSKSVSPDGDTRAPRSQSITAAMLVDKYGVDEQVAKDYLAIRKAKRAPLTATSLANLIREFDTAGLTVPAGIQVCAARGWQGFKADWLKNGGTNAANQSAGRHRGFEATDAIDEQWLRERRQQQGAVDAG